MYSSAHISPPGSKTRPAGRIILLNGATGKVVQWAEVPDGRETYYSPQILTRSDGSLVSVIMNESSRELSGECNDE